MSDQRHIRSSQSGRDSASAQLGGRLLTVNDSTCFREWTPLKFCGAGHRRAEGRTAKEIRNGLTQYIARQNYGRLGTLDTTLGFLVRAFGSCVRARLLRSELS